MLPNATTQPRTSLPRPRACFAFGLRLWALCLPAAVWVERFTARDPKWMRSRFRMENVETLGHVVYNASLYTEINADAGDDLLVLAVTKQQTHGHAVGLTYLTRGILLCAHTQQSQLHRQSSLST